MKFITFLFFCLVLLLSLVWVANAKANEVKEKEVIGQVIQVRGLVYRKFLKEEIVRRLWTNEPYLKRVDPTKPYETQGLGHGSKIYAGDTIVSSGMSMVKIKLLDDTLLNLGPETSISLDDFQMQNEERRKAEINHLSGIMKMQVKRPIKEGKYNLKLPSTSMGIRGTTLVTEIKDHGEHVALIEGLIDVYVDEQKFPMKAGDMFHYHPIEDQPSLISAPEEMLKLAYEDNLDRISLNKVASNLPHGQLKIAPKLPAGNIEELNEIPARKRSWEDILKENQNRARH